MGIELRVRYKPEHMEKVESCDRWGHRHTWWKNNNVDTDLEAIEELIRILKIAVKKTTSERIQNILNVAISDIKERFLVATAERTEGELRYKLERIISLIKEPGPGYEDKANPKHLTHITSLIKEVTDKARKTYETIIKERGSRKKQGEEEE